jgi:predicted glycoside hydrolase/deacetylase ChbG (UPF0249 family)
LDAPSVSRIQLRATEDVNIKTIYYWHFSSLGLQWMRPGENTPMRLDRIRASTLAALLLCGLFRPALGQSVQERLGYPPNARLLIIHADDVGMAHTVNRASFAALENHWITSASVLVPCPWFPEVAEWASKHKDADLGIHLALNSEWEGFRWGPLSGRDRVPSLLDEQGYFPLDTPQVGKNAKIPEVETELRAQIEWAKKFGVPLTHFDTHMIALGETPELAQLYVRLGEEYHLPILLAPQGPHHAPPGAAIPADKVLITSMIEMQPGVTAKDWRKWYEAKLAALGPGVHEMIVHLAYNDEEMQGASAGHPDWGAAWRQQDLDLVKSPKFQKFLKKQGFVLIGWREMAKAWSTSSDAQ